MYDISIENNKLFSTALMLKYNAFYLNRFRITIFVNKAECKQMLITRPTFMNQRSLSTSFMYVLRNITTMPLLWWVFIWRTCRPDVSGRFLVTKLELVCVT